MSNSPHVVVTGGAGFIGSNLCKALLKRGDRVTVLDNLSTGRYTNIHELSDEPGFKFRRADITKTVAFTELQEVTHVVHLACPASPKANTRIPIETIRAASVGTLNTLELAAKQHARIVVASSSEVYGDPQLHPQSEDYRGNCDPIGRFSAYTEGKRLTEAAAAAHHRNGVRVGIVRPFNIFGPGMQPDDGRVIAAFCAAALRKETLKIEGGSQTRSFLFIDDFVDAMLAMLDCEVFGPINIGSDTNEITIADLARLVVELAGRGTVEITAGRDTDVSVRRPDTTRARELLGWRAHTSLPYGLGDTLDWMGDILADEEAGAR